MHQQVGTALHRWKVFHRYGMFLAVHWQLISTPNRRGQKSLYADYPRRKYRDDLPGLIGSMYWASMARAHISWTMYSYDVSVKSAFATHWYTNCSVAPHLPQFYTHSQSVDFPGKITGSSIKDWWQCSCVRGSTSQNSFPASRNDFWLLTLISYYVNGNGNTVVNAVENT